MLHEDEPGAWEFARELRDRGVPLDDVRLRADVDPIAYAEVAALPRAPPAAHPAHAPRPRRRLRADRRRDGAHAASALDEARLQLVPRGPLLRARRPLGRVARSRPHRDLAGPRALPRRDGGIRRGRLRDRPLRDRRAGRRRAVRGRGAAPALRRPADSGQGPPRPPARARPGASARARARARHRGLGAARARAPGLRARARARRRGSLPRLRLAGAGRDRGVRRSSSCPRSARGSGWSRSRRWSGRDR